MFRALSFRISNRRVWGEGEGVGVRGKELGLRLKIWD